MTQFNSKPYVFRIIHTFYERDILAPLVFHLKSSHTWQTMIVVLAGDIRRNLRNIPTFPLHTPASLLLMICTLSDISNMISRLSTFPPGWRTLCTRWRPGHSTTCCLTGRWRWKMECKVLVSTTGCNAW